MRKTLEMNSKIRFVSMKRQGAFPMLLFHLRIFIPFNHVGIQPDVSVSINADACSSNLNPGLLSGG